MTKDIKDLLGRQAIWQKRRTALSWSEKIRIAEILRPAAHELRARGPDDPKSAEVVVRRPGSTS